MERDMTKGSPMKLILWFTVPLLIGNVFQQLYNMVDTIIVGRYVGVQALAAVGSTGTIMFLIQGFMLGLTAGFTVLTAQRFGAGDVEGMKKTVASAYVLSILSRMPTIILSSSVQAQEPSCCIICWPALCGLWATVRRPYTFSLFRRC